MTPTVSVLIPSKNPGRHLEAAVRSAKAQPETLEVVVADAGSTDDSTRIAADLGATIIALGDVGQVAARNQLASHARGDWVQWLDADDYLLPGKLAAQLAAADDADVVYCDAQVLHGRDRIERRLNGLSPLAAAVLATPVLVHAYLTRTPLARAVPFDAEYERGGCVAKWALDLHQAGARFVHVPIVGCVWRQGWSEQQTSANRAAAVAGFDRLRREVARSGPPSLAELLSPTLPHT